MSDAETVTDDRRAKRRASKILAVLGLLFAVAIFLGGWVASKIASGADNAVGNVIFAICTLIATSFLYFWLLRRRSIPIVGRILISLAPFVVGAIWLIVYQFNGFNAELVPQFKPRFASRDASVSARLDGIESAQAFDPVADMDESFRSVESTQFFGSNRNGNHPGIALASDWNANPPKEIWRISLGPAWSSFAVRDGIAVTMEQTPDEANENLLAVRMDNGKPLWSILIPGSHSDAMGGKGPRSTPVIHNDLVVGVSSQDAFVVAKLSSGKLIHQEILRGDLSQPGPDFSQAVYWGRSGSPLVHGNLLIIPTGVPGDNSSGIHTMTAYDLESFSPKWRAGTEQVSYASPLVATLLGVEQLVYTSEQHVSGYDLATGQALWQYPWDSSSSGAASTSQPVCIDDSDLLLSKGYLKGCQRIHLERQGDQWSATQIWKNSNSLKTKLTSAVIHGDFAYGLNDGKLECVDLKDGKRKWMKARLGHGQVLSVGDKLLATSEDGDLLLYKATPEACRELARQHAVDGITWNIPTLAGRFVIVRNASEAVCYALPVEASPAE